LTLAELERLQKIVLVDARFVRLGLRTEGGFIGMHERTTQEPLPDHLSARAQDLPALVEGVIAFKHRAITGKLDPLVAAAAVAFGFVYIHPFEDGNGRLHRWLIHHVRARWLQPAGIGVSC
jgi:Fic family protein